MLSQRCFINGSGSMKSGIDIFFSYEYLMIIRRNIVNLTRDVSYIIPRRYFDSENVVDIDFSFAV